MTIKEFFAKKHNILIIITIIFALFVVLPSPLNNGYVLLIPTFNNYSYITEGYSMKDVLKALFNDAGYFLVVFGVFFMI